MIAYFPSILGLSIDNIRGRIADLHDLGFADPVKMVTLSPTILGFAIDNIRGRITDLRELGFNDPVRMVTSRPTILGYGRERVLLCGRIAAARQAIFLRWTEPCATRSRKVRCWFDYTGRWS
jgi:hypothetical protein